LVPAVCLLSPVAVYILAMNSEKLLDGYKFGWELLVVNGLLTFSGLLLISSKSNSTRISE